MREKKIIEIDKTLSIFIWIFHERTSRFAFRERIFFPHTYRTADCNIARLLTFIVIVIVRRCATKTGTFFIQWNWKIRRENFPRIVYCTVRGGRTRDKCVTVHKNASAYVTDFDNGRTFKKSLRAIRKHLTVAGRTQ